MSVQPNPACVRATAFYLSALSTADAADGMRKILRALYGGMRERGWPHADAADFAGRFGDQVVERIRDMPEAGHG